MEEAERRLKRLLRRKQVMDFPSIIKAAKGRSRRSVFRDLAVLDYLTSFTHAGRYYTLTDIPQFDEHGLWFFQGIGFSRAGTLKRTLVELVGAADAGHTHNELQSLLHVRVHNALPVGANAPGSPRSGDHGRRSAPPTPPQGAALQPGAGASV